MTEIFACLALDLMILPSVWLLKYKFHKDSILFAIEIWLEVNTNKNFRVLETLLHKRRDIYPVNLHPRYNASLREYDANNRGHVVFQDPAFFGLDQDSLDYADGSLSLLTTENFIDKQNIDFGKPAYEFLLLQIKCALESREYVEHIRKWIDLNQKYTLKKGSE